VAALSWLVLAGSAGRSLAAEGSRAVKAHRAALSAVCRSVGGKNLEFRPGFEQRTDFNKDGKPDLVLDDRYLDCHGSPLAAPFCGTGGCGMAVFVLTRSGYVEAFYGQVIEAKIIQADGGNRLEISVHGTQCGLSGSADCRRVLRWNGKKLVPMQ
jgi:hypothetical protein